VLGAAMTSRQDSPQKHATTTQRRFSTPQNTRKPTDRRFLTPQTTRKPTDRRFFDTSHTQPSPIRNDERENRSSAELTRSCKAYFTAASIRHIVLRLAIAPTRHSAPRYS